MPPRGALMPAPSGRQLVVAGRTRRRPAPRPGPSSDGPGSSRSVWLRIYLRDQARRAKDAKAAYEQAQKSVAKSIRQAAFVR